MIDYDLIHQIQADYSLNRTYSLSHSPYFFRSRSKSSQGLNSRILIFRLHKIGLYGKK